MEGDSILRVFILEDNHNRNDAFRKALRGQNVTMCETCPDGMRKFKPPYDLILLDHDLAGFHYEALRKGTDHLPEKQEGSGTEFAKFIADIPEKNGVVIIHSHNPAGADRMTGILRKAGWYVTRHPFDVSLITQLQTMVRPV